MEGHKIAFWVIFCFIPYLTDFGVDLYVFEVKESIKLRKKWNGPLNKKELDTYIFIMYSCQSLSVI